MMSRTPTILICDDDDAIRRLIATILGAANHEFAQAADAPTAIDAVSTAPPDLVILDVNVPGDGGGLSVLDHVRKTPGCESTKVLLVSGVAEAFDEGWGVSLGADGHLAKPFELMDLRAAVQALLPA